VFACRVLSIEAPQPDGSEEIRSEFLNTGSTEGGNRHRRLRSIASYRRAVPGIGPYLTDGIHLTRREVFISRGKMRVTGSGFKRYFNGRCYNYEEQLSISPCNFTFAAFPSRPPYCTHSRQISLLWDARTRIPAFFHERLGSVAVPLLKKPHRPATIHSSIKTISGAKQVAIRKRQPSQSCLTNRCAPEISR